VIPTWARQSSVTVLKAGTVTDMGRTQLSWATPTTVVTVNGMLQPARTQVLERTGLLAKDAPFEAILDPVSLAPQSNRLQVNAVDYEIVHVEAWPTHTLALVREVS
jgi:hypothetical protein